MHLVTIPVPLEQNARILYLDGQYIMEDRNAAELMLQFSGRGISMTPFAQNWFAQERVTNPHERLLVAGGIAMGDAIMLTPALRALQAKYPKAKISVACGTHYRQALLNLDYIHGFEEWPLSFAQSETFDALYFVEGFMDHPLARTHHTTDVFAAMLGVTVTDYKTDYRTTADETNFVWETFPKLDGRKRLGLQVQASHRCRTYPADQLRALMELMVKSGWEVYLMGAPHEYGCQEQKHLYDLRLKAPSFRESAAFLQSCDAFVGPDSGFLHVAGALGVPAVGLYSVYPWKLRTQHYPSVYSIQGVGECSPCFHNPNALQPMFPRQGLCASTKRLPGQERRCEVLAEITPERIKAKVEQLISAREPA